MTEIQKTFLPPEWHKQAFVQLTWPHENSDWQYMLNEVTQCFLQLANAISQREKLLIVAPDIESVKKQLSETNANISNITLFSCPTNDTWARDHAFVTLLRGDTPIYLDFKFNGWGEKFEAEKDNKINKQLYRSGILQGEYIDHLSFILEGGSIESDGQGTILTTTQCLMAKNRNQPLSKSEIEQELKQRLAAERILWLDHGNLIGDDTDGHIDTIARMCPNNTILYVKWDGNDEEQKEDLQMMEEQLKSFTTIDGKPYRLLPLPSPTAIYDDQGERLPATYANFLIINGALLYPTYNQPTNDAIAQRVIEQAFPQHVIIGIDCSALIKQHGSLHCVTMQYPQP